MITSNKWLKEFIPELNINPQEFADKLTVSGSKVENYNYLNAGFSNVIIAQIIAIENHPDADRLKVCKVNIGSEIIQVVTAAKNIEVNQKVLLVLPGGFVSSENGEKLNIKKGKLRGVDSFGMFCSVQELGYSTDMFPDCDPEGIYVLPSDAPIGESADKYLGLNDFITEYEITSNRVDCFSMYGMAREVAATFNLRLLPYSVKEYNDTNNLSDYISVTVNSDLCKRYCLRIVKNVKIQDSPKWLQEKLRSVGIRPINNIVDITNYVMTEIGQPMHAFDYKKIKGNKIIIDTNKEIKKIVTLDNVERNLDENTLLINDGEGPIAVAGIMGCKNSKVSNDCTTIAFESACFDGTNIRISSKKLGLRSESSAKFEKDIDPNTALIAINKACNLIEKLGCGEVVDGLVDIHSDLTSSKFVDFDIDRCNRFLGTSISKYEVINIFKKLEIEWDEENNKVKVPYFRHDLVIFEDIAEEVARFYGYDKIPTTMPKTSTLGKISNNFEIKDKSAQILNSYGYNEIMTYSFEGRSVFNKLLIEEESELKNTVQIRNPLGEEFSIMRTLPYNGMLNSLKTNVKNRNKDIRLFEFANTYFPNDNELPDEKLLLSIGAISEEFDFFDIKGVVEDVIDSFNINKKVKYFNNEDIRYMHTGRQACACIENQKVSEIGQIHPKVAENYELPENVYIGYIDLGKISELSGSTKKFKPVPKYPNSLRDLCFVMDKNLSVIEIEDVFDMSNIEILEDYYLFDVYEGDKLEVGKKSVTYTLSFRANDRTLKDEDISAATKKIIKALEKKRNRVKTIMNTSDFYYELPKDLIAQTPLDKRSESKLLILDRRDKSVFHKRFYNIIDYLEPRDCLVLNNTKVIPARLIGHKKDTGGVVEILLLNRFGLSEKDKLMPLNSVKSNSNVWECLVKPGKKAKIGNEIIFGNGQLRAKIIDILSDGNRLVSFIHDGIFEEILDELGSMPLPPYITEKLINGSRYQTVYAKYDGSAAAPTAGLHFTTDLIQKIKDKGVNIAYVTLHVGLGTFRPVKIENVFEHKMHSEYFYISKEAAEKINNTKKIGGRIIAVGTTACRTLESSVKDGLLCPNSGETDIFIYPGYNFKMVDALITNFHLPESTLMMLISAFADRETILKTYDIAIKEKYRFFSFGDSMFIK